MATNEHKQVALRRTRIVLRVILSLCGLALAVLVVYSVVQLLT